MHDARVDIRARASSKAESRPVSLPNVRAAWFTTADGVRLAITCRPRRGQADPAHRRVVLVAPGLFTSCECPEHQAFAEHLTEIADVVTVDVRGHGQSGGRFSWGVQEPADVAALTSGDTLACSMPRARSLGTF